MRQHAPVGPAAVSDVGAQHGFAHVPLAQACVGGRVRGQQVKGLGTHDLHKEVVKRVEMQLADGVAVPQPRVRLALPQQRWHRRRSRRRG